MVTTKMNWSGPNVIHFGRKSQFGPDHFILVVTKSLWSSPNQFGQTKTILDQPKLFWSHRRTRHYCLTYIELDIGTNLLKKMVKLKIRMPWPSM